MLFRICGSLSTLTISKLANAAKPYGTADDDATATNANDGYAAATTTTNDDVWTTNDGPVANDATTANDAATTNDAAAIACSISTLHTWLARLYKE